MSFVQIDSVPSRIRDRASPPIGRDGWYPRMRVFSPRNTRAGQKYYYRHANTDERRFIHNVMRPCAYVYAEAYLIVFSFQSQQESTRGGGGNALYVGSRIYIHIIIRITYIFVYVCVQAARAQRTAAESKIKYGNKKPTRNVIERVTRYARALLLFYRTHVTNCIFHVTCPRQWLRRFVCIRLGDSTGIAVNVFISTSGKSILRGERVGNVVSRRDACRKSWELSPYTFSRTHGTNDVFIVFAPGEYFWSVYTIFGFLIHTNVHKVIGKSLNYYYAPATTRQKRAFRVNIFGSCTPLLFCTDGAPLDYSTRSACASIWNSLIGFAWMLSERF